MNAILLSFLISLAVNAVFFAIAAIRRTDVLTDLSTNLPFPFPPHPAPPFRRPPRA